MHHKQSHPTFSHKALVAIGLAIAVCIIYIQTGSHQFLSYDDDLYVSSNQNVQAGLTPASIKWAFTTTYASNYHPLTWLSHMLDYQLFGLTPGNHHLMNVFLHLVNTLLIFLLLNILTATLWRSAMVAALFACHPLHVESVAWIAERKDLLSTLFWILTLLCYHYYLKTRTWQRYALVILCFIAGLMAKPMLVTLPFVLLLLDLWPYQRYFLTKESALKLIQEKIPLFILSLLSCLITYYAQQQGNSMISLTNFPLIARLSNAATSYVSYLNKTIWPAKMAIFYPYPDSIQILETGGAVLLLLLITYFCAVRIKKQPYLVMGWFWYLGSMIPVIGLVQVGEQAMADRYTYIPLIGIFIILVWGTNDLFKHCKNGLNRKRYLTLIGITAVSLCTFISFRQCGYWKNNVEVFKHAIKVTDQNYLAHFQLGTAYAKSGEFALAETHLRKTISQKPGTAQAYNNLAYVLERQGQLGEAITNYQQSATLDPNNREAHYNLGIIYLQRWELNQAIHNLQRALQIAPGDSMAQKNLLKAKNMQARQKDNMQGQ